MSAIELGRVCFSLSFPAIREACNLRQIQRSLLAHMVALLPFVAFADPPEPKPQRIEITGDWVPREITYSEISLTEYLLRKEGYDGGSPRFDQSPGPRIAYATPNLFAKEQPEENPADNNEKPKICSVNPVNLATGAKYMSEQDFIAPGEYGMGMVRSYLGKSTRSGMFGPKWSGTYDYPHPQAAGCDRLPLYAETVYCVPHTVTYTAPDGASYTYTRTGSTATYKVRDSAAAGVFVFDPDVGSWTLIKPNFYIYFEAGKVQVVSSSQKTLYFAYNAPGGKLSSVSNNAGRTVNFTWTGFKVTSITDPGSNVWTYTYDANGMLKTVTAPGSSSSRTYHYEDATDATLLSGLTVDTVRIGTYTYDTSKRVTQVAHTSGERLDTFAYAPNQTTMTDIYGQQTVYSFANVLGSLKLITVSRVATSSCPAASGAISMYDSNGWPDYSFDWNGIKTVYHHDAGGRLLDVTRAVGTPLAQTTVNFWNGTDLVGVDYKDTAGNVYLKAIYTYFYSDGPIQTVKLVDPATGVQRLTTYGYTLSPTTQAYTSLTVTQALPSGSATTTTTFDTQGNISTVTNAMGHVTTYSAYNGLGLPGRVTDPNGVSTDFAYDSRGNLVTKTLILPTGNRVTTYAYDGERRVTDIYHATGQIERSRFNSSGRLISTELSGDITTYGLNVAARTMTSSRPRKTPILSGGAPQGVTASPFTTAQIFDSLGRTQFILGNNGQSTQLGYDGNGNVVSRVETTSALPRTTSFEYNAYNQKKKHTAADGGVTQFAYDSAGRLAGVTDPRNLVTSYSYNGFGDQLSRTSPDTGATSFAYDVAGRTLSESRANAKTISYGWDSLGRMTSRTSGGITETFTYDAGAYGKGRLTSINDASGQTTFTYDAAGQLVSQVASILGSSPYATSWSYDTAGHLTGMTYPNGQATLQFARDGYGRLASISSGGATLADSFLYQPGPSSAMLGVGAMAKYA